MVGGMLSATDPVAVVAILKELGIAESLSMLIEGRVSGLLEGHLLSCLLIATPETDLPVYFSLFLMKGNPC